jgi:hypothetical protein
MRETTENSVNHWNVNRGQTNNGYMAAKVEATPQHRDTTTTSYTGAGASKNPALRVYDAELGYQPSNLKADTIKGRFGNSNTNVFNNSVNYQGKPKDLDMVNNREAMPKMPYVNAGSIGTYQQKSQNLDSNVNVERMSPDMYNVLQQNPYAIKLTYK